MMSARLEEKPPAETALAEVTPPPSMRKSMALLF
jgi:hypothetical protein